MFPRISLLPVLSLLLVSEFPVSAADPLPAINHVVEAASKPGKEWKSFPTRTLADLPALAEAPIDGPLTPYGGLTDRSVRPSGFFRTEKINGRWWLIDPSGGLFINKGVVSVRQNPTDTGADTLQNKFGSETQWAESTAKMLASAGFNGTGSWTENELISTVSPRLVTTKLWTFMASYGKQRGGTYQQPGHTGYLNDCIFVFDPEWEPFCEEYAQKLAETKDDPWLLGHFSDNELPLTRAALKNFLTLPPNEAGYHAAWEWLRTRHGAKASLDDITEQDSQDFLALVVERYYKPVSAAIRKADPNHLYLGSRFHSQKDDTLAMPEIFRACGPYLDVVSVNYYRAWTPDPKKLAMWEKESGRPSLITEWYAKGADSGMPNTGGAGWLVRTQAERGLFYQNFTLALLESRVCVGWHWFKYSDNDPDDKKTDPSNRDSNKGIVSSRYEPYSDLLSAMKPLNERCYSIADFFDKPNL